MAKLTIKNPATDELLGEAPILSEFEVKAAVTVALKAYPSWRDLGFEGRARLLMKARSLLLARMEELSVLISKENGKPLFEAIAQDVMLLMEVITYYAKNTEKILKKEKVRVGKWAFMGHHSHIEYEPRGVIGVIGPWNYPVSNPFGPAVMGLMAGNAVLVKPSEFTPLAALKVGEIFHEAGIPKNIFQIITGDGSTGAALLKSGINHISFIGSVKTGKKIMAQASETLTPITLELGGKDPLIVCSDADLDLASSAAVWGAFSNSGQVCASIERVYVHESVLDSFTHLVVEKTKKLKQGPSLSPTTDLASMTAPMQVAVVEKHLEDAKAKGAHVLFGGERRRDLGPQFFAPTILSNVNPDSLVMKDETFGPVLPLVPFNTEDEAIKMANDSPYGLNAYVWTRDVERGMKLASQIQAGTVNVNESLFSFGVPQTPWGGVKQSGLGRTHGTIGLMDMVTMRHVYVNRRPSKKNNFWWFRYSGNKVEMLEGMCFMLFGSGLERLRGLWRYLRSSRKVQTL